MQYKKMKVKNTKYQHTNYQKKKLYKVIINTDNIYIHRRGCTIDN